MQGKIKVKQSESGTSLNPGLDFLRLPLSGFIRNIFRRGRGNFCYECFKKSLKTGHILCSHLYIVYTSFFNFVWEGETFFLGGGDSRFPPFCIEP